MTTTKQKVNKQKPFQNLLMIFAAHAAIYLLAFVFFGVEANATQLLIFGGIMLTLFGAAIYYIIFSDAQVFNSYKKCGVISLTMTLNFLLMVLFDAKIINLPFIVPYAMGTLIVGTLVDRRLGIYTNIAAILAYLANFLVFGSGNISGDTLLMLLYPIFGGLLVATLASHSVDKNPTRLTYILSGLFLGLIAAVAGLFCYLMSTDGFVVTDFVSVIVQGFLSGPIAVMFLFLLVPIFERIFNIVTNFRLAEICSGNQPLLVRLYEQAPGTFSHSITIANYMDLCAQALDENPYLARACAFYHDIGKLNAPQFYTENQSGHNPHDELTPEASVLAIKRHISYGLTLAKKYKLPSEVQAAIAEHHGTMPIKTFYIKAKKYIDGDLPFDEYRYDGPLPHGKINAMLMIVDACEAALRSITDRESAEKVINAVVTERMDFGQFDECELSIKEINIIKNTVITTFAGNAHTRVAYPAERLKDVSQK